MTERLLLAQLSVDVSRLEKQMQRSGLIVRRGSDRMARDWNRATDRMTRDTERWGRDVRRVIAGLGIAAVISDVTSLADAWTDASNQIEAAATVTGVAGASLQDIADIARDTRTAFDATAQLYSRLTIATQNLDVTQADLLGTTRLINQAFIAGGAGASEQRSAILQLSQALQSGVLQGDELRSLRENSPLLLQAIANEFETTTGALKELGAQGELTTERVFAGLRNAGDLVTQPFLQTETTVSQAMQNLRTSVTQYVGETDQALGGSRALAGAISFVADNIETFGDALIIAVALLGARGIGGALDRAGKAGAAYALGIRKSTRQILQDLRAQSEEAKRKARVAGKAVTDEQRALASLEQQRDSLRSQSFLDPGSQRQFKRLKEATDEVARATKKADEAIEEYGISSRQATLAIAALTNAEKEREKILDNATDLNKKRIAVDEDIVKTTEKVEAAMDRATAADKAATVAKKNLARASNIARRSLSRLLGFFGGPIGLAMTAAGAAMAYFATETLNAARNARAIESALRTLSDAQFENADASELSAAASEALAKRLEAQARATEALQEIESRRLKTEYLKGLKAAREELDRLTKSQKSLMDASSAGGMRAGIFQGEAGKLDQDIADAREYVDILNQGLAALEELDFRVNKKSGSGQVRSEVVTTGGGDGGATSTTSSTIRLKNEKDIIAEIKRLYDDLFTFELDQIDAVYQARLAAIDKSASKEAEKARARAQAEEIWIAERANAEAEYAAQQEQTAARAEQERQRQLQFLEQLKNARDATLGKFNTIAARQFEAERERIKNEIADAELRDEALRTLAEEEVEWRRRAAEEIKRLAETDDVDSKIQRVVEAEERKLQALQEALEEELITRQEHAELVAEIERQSVAEQEAIRMASNQVMLAGMGTFYQGMTSLMAAAFGQQSGIAKAAFLAEKAAALATAYVNGQVAIAKAAASAPPPKNLPAIAAAKLVMAGTIAGIVATTIAGFEKGGAVGYTGGGSRKDVRGVVHGGEYVFTKDQTSRVGTKQLEMIAKGFVPNQVVPLPVNVTGGSSKSVSFGDTVFSVPEGTSREQIDEIKRQFDQHQRHVRRIVDKGFAGRLQGEINRTVPRHKRG